MREWSIEIINNYGYWGIMLLTLLESIVPIVPAEIILTLGGFMTTYTELTKNGVILYATVGEMVGAITLYSIGRFFSLEKLEGFTEGKVANAIGFKKEGIHKARAWFNQKGKYSVLFCRCIPVIGSLISIPAGMAEMNLGVFFVFTLIGISIWNTVLVTLGVAAEASWELIARGAGTFSTLVAYVFVASVVINGYILYKKKKK